MARREFLQLADTYIPGKHSIGGWYISEKLDGTRCFWDGGISRGLKTADVPWASVKNPKTGEPKEKVKPYATGLWSRYGNPIIAPDWFLDSLPLCPLDGELWAGRGGFQLCRSICAGDEPDARFAQIKYAVYSTPAFDYVFSDGEIKNTNHACQIDLAQIRQFAHAYCTSQKFMSIAPARSFAAELRLLEALASELNSETAFVHGQAKLPDDEQDAIAFANAFMEEVLNTGGEGVVFRNPDALWTPKRHKGILKYKPYEDAEGKIIGYVCGKEGKQGNVLGKIGALQVRTTSLKCNVDFEIGSGLTFEQREFATPEMSAIAAKNQAKPVAGLQGKHLRIGDTITFKYRELSDDGIPKEGRFFRKRDVE